MSDDTPEPTSDRNGLVDRVRFKVMRLTPQPLRGFLAPSPEKGRAGEEFAESAHHFESRPVANGTLFTLPGERKLAHPVGIAGSFPRSGVGT
jgi:hypothetical protein